MNLRLDIRLGLEGGTDAEQEAVREAVTIEARKFTAQLADAIEETGIEVEVEGIDHVRPGRWHRMVEGWLNTVKERTR